MTGHPDYKLILDEMWELHCRKASSYGSDEDPLANLRSGERFGMTAWKRCLVEAESAFYRMENYCNGRNTSDENAENALMDAAAFSLLGLLFLREERAKRHAEVADAEYEYDKKQDEFMAKAGFFKWSDGRYKLYPEPEPLTSEEDPETELFHQTLKVSHDFRTGYREPSEEIGNRMLETLEKAK